MGSGYVFDYSVIASSSERADVVRPFEGRRVWTHLETRSAHHLRHGDLRLSQTVDTPATN
jgi:hypothetical protein